MKKSIPLSLRKVLEVMAQKDKGLFEVKFHEDIIISFVDVDKSSDFHFTIETEDTSKDKAIYTLNVKPSGDTTLKPNRDRVYLEGIIPRFEKWLSLLKEYNNQSPLFDDYISQSYYDELEPEFDILDEDADIKPYSIVDQGRIIHFLNVAEQVISENVEQDEDTIKALNLIELTKKAISKSTKREVVKNIRTIIAKGFKIGYEVGQKLLIEFSTELAKKLIMGSAS